MAFEILDIIHATSKIFGSLKKLELIDFVDEKDRLFRKPKARQSFVGNVLHREKKERKNG